MTVAKVQPHECPLTITNSALVYLFGIVVQLMPVEMLCPGVALPATLLGALKLLVQTLAASASLPCGPFLIGRVGIIPISITVFHIL